MTGSRQIPERLHAEIATLRDMMLTVHYFEESHWLAAAVAFPSLCRSAVARQALRNAATIAWQFGFPTVTHWINTDVLAIAATGSSSDQAQSADHSSELPSLSKTADAT